MAAEPSNPSQSSARPDWADSASLAKASAESAESGDGTSAKLTPADDAWWTDEHGISIEVRDARPYHRYDAGEADELIEATHEGFHADTVSVAKGKTKHAPGWIMEARPFPEMGFPPIAPQLRPDVPAPGEAKLSYHPFEPAEDPRYPEGHKKAGQRIPVPKGGRWPTPWQMRFHILRAKDPDDHGWRVAHLFKGPAGRQLRRELLTDPERESELLDVLREAMGGNEAPHLQRHAGKYILPYTSRRPLEHDHADYAPVRIRFHEVASQRPGEIVRA